MGSQLGVANLHTTTCHLTSQVYALKKTSEDKSESYKTNYGETGYTTHWTQNEAFRGDIRFNTRPLGRSKPTGNQLWRQQQQREEGGGHCQQELWAAELTSDPAASEPAAVLLYPAAAAVSSEPATNTRG